MKAVVLHGPGDLRVDDVDEPGLPPGGLVVRTAAVGICGSDIRSWRHGSPRLRGPQVIGHEFSGVVSASDDGSIATGTPVAVCPGAPCLACRACLAGRANLCQRRRVLGYDLPGGMAELVAIPADWIRTGGVVALDPGQPVEHGAIVEPLHTVLNGQDAAGIGAGMSVLVLGLGPIGVLHVAVAASLGAGPVLGVDPIADRVAAAEAVLGAGRAVLMEPGWEDRALAALDGRFDVVVIATGAPAALATAIELTEPGGRILAFAGMPADASVVDLDVNVLHYRQLSIVGAFGGTPATFRRAAAWLAASDFDAARYTARRFPLADAAEAFASVERGDGLKTLLLSRPPT